MFVAALLGSDFACDTNWPDAFLGASTVVRVGSLDLTGRFSGWSDPVTVTMPTTYEMLGSPPDGGCASFVPDAGSPAAAANAPATPGSGPEAQPGGGCSLVRQPGGPGWALALVASAAVWLTRRRRRATSGDAIS